MARVAWSHDETVVALGLYFRLTFSKVNMHHPEVVRVASLLGRTSSALAMKIVNIARCDPTLRAKGISGLKNGAQMEADVWNEYDGKCEKLAEDYDRLLKGRVSIERDSDEDLKVPAGLDRVGVTKYRVNQSFFRHAVLSAYETKCCITGISDARLLVASHIRPWADCADGNDKTTPENGLCLNTLHDKAFDRGLLTLDDDYKVVLSKAIKEVLTRSVYYEYFGKFEGKSIALPVHHLPRAEFLDYHRNHVFVK